MADFKSFRLKSVGFLFVAKVTLNQLFNLIEHAKFFGSRFPSRQILNKQTHTHIDVNALKGKCKLMFTDGTTKLLN